VELVHATISFELDPDSRRDDELSRLQQKQEKEKQGLQLTLQAIKYAFKKMK